MFRLRKISEKKIIEVDFTVPLINKKAYRDDKDISSLYPLENDPFFTPGVDKRELTILTIEANGSYLPQEFLEFLQQLNTATTEILQPASPRILQAYAPKYAEYASDRDVGVNAYGQICANNQARHPWRQLYCSLYISLGRISLTEWPMIGYVCGVGLVVVEPRNARY